MATLPAPPSRRLGGELTSVSATPGPGIRPPTSATSRRVASPLRRIYRFHYHGQCEANAVARIQAAESPENLEYVSLDLSGCDYDVRGLIELAERARVTDDLLAAPFLGEVEKALGVASEEWLPGWEEIERRATDGRSGAGSLITHVRDRIAAAHLTLLEALADACLTGQQPDRAIPHLEEAVGRRPERVALARKLANAYERSGQTRRAAQLREEYGLDEAS